MRIDKLLRLAMSMAATCLLAWSSATWACPVSGRIVCDTDPSVALPDVLVTLTALNTLGGPWVPSLVYSATSGADGSFATRVSSAYWPPSGGPDPTFPGVYDVNLLADNAYCDPMTGALINLGTIALPDPIRCPADGCTLTWGYWKTHSEYGPARYDETWGMLPAGADTSFFLSGQTYMQVLSTEPSVSKYYILAHQYIAAQLSQLAGASISGAALTAFNSATTFLATHNQAAVDASPALQAQAVALAFTLDEYNNGLAGPGHCE